MDPETYYRHKMQMFIIRVFVPGKPFQLSLMFAGKARVYPSVLFFRPL